MAPPLGIFSKPNFVHDIKEARRSGPGLAHLIREVRRNAKRGLKISLLSHSLGAEVLLSGLSILAKADERIVDAAIMTEAAVPPSYLAKTPNPFPTYRWINGNVAIEDQLSLDWGRYADAPEALQAVGGVPALYSFFSNADHVLSFWYPFSGQPVALGLRRAEGLGSVLRQIDTTPGRVDPSCPVCGIGSHSAYVAGQGTPNPEEAIYRSFKVFQRLAELLNK